MNKVGTAGFKGLWLVMKVMLWILVIFSQKCFVLTTVHVKWVKPNEFKFQKKKFVFLEKEFRPRV